MYDVKLYGSRYWLYRLIDNDDDKISSELDQIPGVKVIRGSGVPSKGSQSEKSLEKFLTDAGLITKEHEFYNWWVQYPGKKPTWDYICRAEIDGKSGLILLEAKAHKGETTKTGKARPVRGKVKDVEQANVNYDQIERNIIDEFRRLGKSYHTEGNGYYQIANRIAYASKIHSILGVPVLLVFFGFIGDCHFPDKWENEEIWKADMKSCFKALNITYPLEREGFVSELSQGGPYIACLSKKCTEIV